MLTETAPAKLNLALHVRARRPDDYHELETLFAFCEDGDELSAARLDRPGWSQVVTGPFAEELAGASGDLVGGGLARFAEAFGVEPNVRLTLDKRLPIAAGLGGGSADAAATLRLLNRLFPPERPMEDLVRAGAPLGADVPACVVSRTCRGEGRGDRLTPATHPFGAAPTLLVNPRVPVPTGPVFAAWDGVDRGPLGGDPAGWRNDLQAPAIRLAPVIGDVLAWLQEQPGAAFTRMSGSGATCFALFDSDAARDEADARLAREHADWWRLATRLRPD